MSKKEKKIAAFDPNGIGQTNGRFIGLPFNEKEAKVVLLPAPWDVTTSAAGGTSNGPELILEASYQLDLLDVDVPDAWKMGIFMRPVDANLVSLNMQMREKAIRVIDYLEGGGIPEENHNILAMYDEINDACERLNNWIYVQSKAILESGKLVGLVGGDHSTPYGYLKALGEMHENFGILQIDAHMDLRKAYEGFEWSHASIYHNTLTKIKSVTKLTQVGIRDYCEEELAFVEKHSDKISIFYDHLIRRQQFAGNTFERIVDQIIFSLPQKVYVSFDVDGLSPELCPNTGTPVPGGLSYQEAIFILKKLVASGRTIIGFDVCEVNGTVESIDGNVGARLVYKLANLLGYNK